MKKVLGVILAVALLVSIYSEVAVAQFGGSGAFGDVAAYLKRCRVSIIPSADGTYDLGSSSKAWRNIYVGGISPTGNITMATTTWIGLGAAAGRLVFTDATPDTLNIDDANFTVSDGPITSGSAGTDGQLAMYSEQGATDYSVTLNPNAAMTSAAAFYLPADEAGSTLPITCTSGGVLAYNSQAVETTSSPTFVDLTADELELTGCNVTYVPIGGDIETYVANATAGDTLVLASGTYTITDDIDVAKNIVIRGQGSGCLSTAGHTVITCATANKNMIDVTSGNLTLMDVELYGTVGCTGIRTSSGYPQLENVNIFITAGAGTGYGIYANGGDTEIRGCRIQASSGTGGTCTAIHINHASSSLGLYNCYLISSASGGGVSTTVNVTDGYFQGYFCMLRNSASTSGTNADVTNYFSAHNCSFTNENATCVDLKNNGAATIEITDCDFERKNTSGTITYLGNNSQFQGANIQILSLGDNIETAIAAATAGDTLILAAGTYTITDDIDVGKGVNIVGQGIGKTTIACATASKNIFDISTSNVRIADLSISNTGTTTKPFAISGVGGTVLTGVVLENLSIASTRDLGAEMKCVHYLDASGTMRDVVITDNNSGGAYASYGISCETQATAEANCTLNIYNCSSIIIGTAEAAGILVHDNSATNDAIVYVYDSIFTGLSATSKVGAWILGTDAILYGYNSTFNGASYDVKTTGTTTLSGCTLANTLLSGAVDFSTNDGWGTWTSTLAWNTANPEAAASDVLSATGRYKVVNGTCYFTIYAAWDDGEGSTGLATATLPLTVADNNVYIPCDMTYLVNATYTVGMADVDATAPAGLLGRVGAAMTDGQGGSIAISGSYEL